MQTKLILAAVIIFAGAGCRENEVAKSPVSAPPIVVDLKTPDKALRSYWAVRDAIRAEDFARERDLAQAERAKLDKRLSSVSLQPVVQSFLPIYHHHESFSRDLVEVKVETDSRAVAEAVIKNVTWILPGAEVAQFETELREKGERYRYVLEKGLGGLEGRRNVGVGPVCPAGSVEKDAT